MSLTIDTRAGSQDLILPLQQLGVSVSPGNLAAGDAEFVGNGPEGPVVCLVEYKKLGDLFQCMRDGRFADQLRKMKEAGDYSWLLIEGRLRGFAPGSVLHTQLGGGRWRRQDAGITYQELVGWVTTMAAVSGCHVWRTESLEESAVWLRGLYHWWTAKEWEQHRAHLDFYVPPITGGNPFKPPTLVQKVANVLPRVGGVKSYRVSQHFKTVREMVNAAREEWTQVKGIGPKDSETITRALEEEE
jgi:ERCC4-type nuclease